MPETSERRKEQIRKSVAAGRARQAAKSPAERAAWGVRVILGDDFDPYTPEERKSLENIRASILRLQAEAEALNEKMKSRIREEMPKLPALAAILVELEAGQPMRVLLKPH